MHRIRIFLKAKYCAIFPELEEHKKQGHEIVKCFACSYESAILREEIEPLFLQECLVCRAIGNVLKFPCPECSSDIVINDPHAAFCSECDHDISIEYLIEKYGDDTGTKEYHTTPTHAHCCECEYFPVSVVPLGDEWICLSCLAVHSAIKECNYCGQMSTGDLSDSYLTGCSQCDGKFGSSSFQNE